MNDTVKTIRTRIAPSPTGMMHIGTLRTMLYSYYFAKKNNGEILLRIEDTDQSRKVDGAVESLEKMIAWAGISYDGKMTFQSNRLDLYKEHVKTLLDNRTAYHCFCTPERLDAMRKEQQIAKKPPMYDRTCCALSEDDVQKRIDAGEKYVIRMKVPRGEDVFFDDVVRGKVSFSTNTIDDQVLMKSDGFPTYHLANVVDDHDMGITHVIRGEEWLSSTPKHILLYRAFGWDAPRFAHLPLLLNADRSKLSKRQGDVCVEDYIEKGYLRDALINFVALLGWNPGKGSTEEIFSMKELIEQFDLAKVHKAGAVVDPKKLNWMNAQYIKRMSIDDLYKCTLSFLEKKEYYDPTKHSEVFIRKLLTVEQERLETLDGIGEENLFFFQNISVEKELLRWKENSDEETIAVLTKARTHLEGVSEKEWTRENLEKLLMDAAGEKRGDFLWPLRAALTGEKRSPSPFDCAWVLGKEETLKRVTHAIEL